MAGGARKGFGIALGVLGGLGSALGLGAWGIATLLLQADMEPEAREFLTWAQGLGLVTGVVALVVLLLGIGLARSGGAAARRELLETVLLARGGPASPPPMAPQSAAQDAGPAGLARGRASTRIVVGVGVALVAGLVLGLVWASPSSDGGAQTLSLLPGSGGDAAAQPVPQPVANQSYEGRVSGGRAPLVGSLNLPGSTALHELPLEPGTVFVEGTLNWTSSGSGGASQLVLILEWLRGEEWEELARGEGGPGLVVVSPLGDLAPKVRARVFAGGAGYVDQAYALELKAWAP